MLFARRIITLCGSSRFPEAHALANMHLSLMGHIVIPLSCFGHADQPAGAKHLTDDGNERSRPKIALDQLHLEKIALSDAIYVINVGDYIGASTMREIAYARELGKDVFYMLPRHSGDLIDPI